MPPFALAPASGPNAVQSVFSGLLAGPSGGGTVDLSFPNPTRLANTCVLFFVGSCPLPTAITDSQGNFWTQVSYNTGSEGTPGANASIWYAPLQAGALTVQITIPSPGGGMYGISIAEWGGQYVPDTAGAGSGAGWGGAETGDGFTTSAIGATVANDVLVAAYYNNAEITAPWTCTWNL